MRATIPHSFRYSKWYLQQNKEDSSLRSYVTSCGKKKNFSFFRAKEKLLAEHKAAWKALWETGRIEIEGDLEMAQAVYGSMYYILSSTRSDWPYGLSPGGLPGGEEYMGHTFWDQDIWMYPPLVLLHPDLARSALKYRKDRLPAARRIAKKYGFKGKRRHYSFE